MYPTIKKRLDYIRFIKYSYGRNRSPSDAARIIPGERGIKMSDLTELLNELLKDGEFRREYEALESEFTIKQARHKTLEERAAEYGGELPLDGEFDYGDPIGREIW